MTIIVRVHCLKHVQKRHTVTIGLIFIYAVYMMVNSGIRIVGHLGVGGISVPGNRTNPHREASKTQLSQMPFILPKAWGYFFLWVMNLTAPLLPHFFAVSIATH